MAEQQYPVDLPAPKVTPYSVDEGSHTRQNKVQSGPPRVEFLTNKTAAQFTVEFLFSSAQYRRFESWWVHSVNYGSLPFDMPLKVAMGRVSHECYMATPSKPKPNGLKWMVKARLVATEKRFDDAVAAALLDPNLTGAILWGSLENTFTGSFELLREGAEQLNSEAFTLASVGLAQGDSITFYSDIFSASGVQSMSPRLRFLQAGGAFISDSVEVYQPTKTAYEPRQITATIPGGLTAEMTMGTIIESGEPDILCGIRHGVLVKNA